MKTKRSNRFFQRYVAIALTIGTIAALCVSAFAASPLPITQRGALRQALARDGELRHIDRGTRLNNLKTLGLRLQDGGLKKLRGITNQTVANRAKEYGLVYIKGYEYTIKSGPNAGKKVKVAAHFRKQAGQKPNESAVVTTPEQEQPTPTVETGAETAPQAPTAGRISELEDVSYEDLAALGSAFNGLSPEAKQQVLDYTEKRIAFERNRFGIAKNESRMTEISESVERAPQKVIDRANAQATRETTNTAPTGKLPLRLLSKFMQVPKGIIGTTLSKAIPSHRQANQLRIQLMEKAELERATEEMKAQQGTLETDIANAESSFDGQHRGAALPSGFLGKVTILKAQGIDPSLITNSVEVETPETETGSRPAPPTQRPTN